MINVGLDCLGSDKGQIIFLDAICSILNNDNSFHFFLYGKENEIKDYLINKKIDTDKITIIDSKEEILVSEHPVFALRTKPNSSLMLAKNDLLNNKIDCLISAGSTGAIVALAELYIKTIENVKRPTIAALIPTIKNPMLLIDAGANVDPEPKWLYQYAILGNVYMKNIFNIDNPRIGLLNIGVEESKGNELTKNTYNLLKQNKDINFVGNIEAREVTSGVCDLLITDAFSGNIVLKMYEGTAKNILSILKSIIKSNLLTLFAGLIIKKPLKNILKKFDVSNYGGAPLIGSNRLIIKCHGSSNSTEIKNAIYEAKTFIEKDLINKFSDSLKEVNYGI